MLQAGAELAGPVFGRGQLDQQPRALGVGGTASFGGGQVPGGILEGQG
jgi:hypothetical protein